MKIQEIITNKLFLAQNVFSNELIDNAILTIKKNIENKNFIVRYNYTNEIGDVIDIRKPYNELDEKSKNLFDNSNLLGIGGHKIYEISHENKLKHEINHITKINVLSEIYKGVNLISDAADFFLYDVGNYMKKHNDYTNDNNRISTAILYLNDMEDSFVGGELIFYDDFDNIIYTYKPKRGDLLILNSSDIFEKNNKGIMHAVPAIENWQRYTFRAYWNKII